MSFQPKKFTEKLLNGKEIKWLVVENSTSPIHSVGKSVEGTSNIGTINIGEQNNLSSKRSQTEKNDERPYYQIPFSESVDAVMNGTYKGNGAIFVRTTPKLYESIGFARLPIMTTANHVKSIYSPKESEIDHNHEMGELIKQLPDALEMPLMIITSETHPDTSVVVIAQMERNYQCIICYENSEILIES